MITFPRTADEVARLDGEVRAGGTDLQERLGLGMVEGPLIDLRDVSGLSSLQWHDGKLQVGSRVTVAKLADSQDVRRHYPGLARAASGLATPQIRNVGTVGGNILQRVRCWYFRNPNERCLKKGGDDCLARAGDHLYHSCFDLGPCVAPHPSTLAMALLAYDATVALQGSVRELTLADLLGDGSDPTRENALPDGALLTTVSLPEPWPEERAAYHRTISRARAEWPLVEAVARLTLDGGRVDRIAVALGAVANVPLRLSGVEEHLHGRRPEADVLARAAEVAVRDAKPLPQTAYKVELAKATVVEALELALKGGSA